MAEDLKHTSAKIAHVAAYFATRATGGSRQEAIQNANDMGGFQNAIVDAREESNKARVNKIDMMKMKIHHLIFNAKITSRSLNIC